MKFNQTRIPIIRMKNQIKQMQYPTVFFFSSKKSLLAANNRRFAATAASCNAVEFPKRDAC